MGRNKKTYTDEFKLKCIKELLDGKAFSEVCSSNNVAPSTLSDWNSKLSSLTYCFYLDFQRNLKYLLTYQRS